MLENPKLWIAVAFVALLALFGRKGIKAMNNALDARSAKIDAELKAAIALRVEAEALLAEYKQRSAQVIKEAEHLLTDAQKQAEALIANAEARTKEAGAKRLQQLEQRLSEESKQAFLTARNEVIERTVDAAKTLVRDHFQTTKNDEIVQRVVSDLSKRAS